MKILSVGGWQDGEIRFQTQNLSDSAALWVCPSAHGVHSINMPCYNHSGLLSAYFGWKWSYLSVAEWQTQACVMWSQRCSWRRSLTSEQWHRESSGEVKGRTRNSAGVQRSQWHWWFGFSESQTDGDSDMYCPRCSEWNICSSGACTASRFPQWLTHCDFSHPQMHTNTSQAAVGRNLINPKMFVLMERNLELQSHVDKRTNLERMSHSLAGSH